jgi:hypothetical protein
MSANLHIEPGPSTLARWCRFNLVGGFGIAAQFAALFLLKSLLGFNYLTATMIAVEAAIVTISSGTNNSRGWKGSRAGTPR